MKRILSKFCVLAMSAALLTTMASAVENPFTDISSDSTLAQAVMWAYDTGITSGTSTTEFSPDATCNRGQVVTFLWRSQGEPVPTSSENPFDDVTSDFYYYNAVLWAVEEGITSGTSTTEFSPDDTCTTAQVLTFLYRANGEPDKTGEGLYYEDAVNWATSNGLASSINPDSQSPRSDIVTYLWKNAGAPAIEVTDPEPVVYTYTMPEYTVPSTTPSFTWQYFAEIGEYLLLSDEDTFAVTFTGYTIDQLKSDTDFVNLRIAAADYLSGQHGDLWSFYNYVTYSNTTGNNTTLTFRLVQAPEYASVSEAEAAIDDFHSQVSDLVTGFYNSGALKETDSEMVVARYLYNWVCDNTVYGSTNTTNQYSGYATLTYGEGVCMGYARLLSALYRTAGIECYGVGCTALHNGDGHTINYAKLDGTWYYIDATFGDTSRNYDTYFAMTRSTVDGIYALDYKWE